MLACWSISLCFLSALFYFDSVASTVSLVRLTSQTFRKFIDSNPCVITFFQSSNCKSCKKKLIEFEKVASVYSGSDKYFSVLDCSTDKAICKEFNVTTVPVAIYFYDGFWMDEISSDSLEPKYLTKFMKSPPIDPIEQAAHGHGTRYPDPRDKPLKAIKYLNGRNFNKFLKEFNGTIVLVVFYEPWCEHTKQAKPLIETTATRLRAENNTDIKITMVNCGTLRSEDLCRSEDIEVHPTMRMFKNGEMWADYKTEVTADGLYKFVTDPPKEKRKRGEYPSEKHADFSLPHITYVNASSFPAVVADPRHDPVLVLFYMPSCERCRRQKYEYALAAHKAADTLALAPPTAATGGQRPLLAAYNCDHDENGHICDKQQLSRLPTMRLFKKGQPWADLANEETVAADDVIYFITHPPQQKSIEINEHKELPPLDVDNEKLMPHVKLLKTQDFNHFITTPNRHSLVMFFSDHGTKNKLSKPQFQAAAAELKITADRSLAAFDCEIPEQHDECDKQGIRVLPTFVHFYEGKKIMEYHPKGTSIIKSDKVLKYMANPSTEPIGVKDEL